MAIPVVESITPSNNDGNSSTFVMDMPTTRPDGDLYVAFVASDSNQASWTPPGNWNVIEENSSGDPDFALYWWIGSSEPATYTVTGGTNQEWSGAIYRISGAHNPAPINLEIAVNTGSSNSPTAPTATPTIDDALVLAFVAIDTDQWDSTDPYPGSPWTNGFDQNSGSAESSSVNAAGAHRGIASQTASGTAVFLANGSDAWIGKTIVISPPYLAVTDVETDEDYDDKDTAVTITGATFETPKGTGKVEMGDDPDYATATKVEQTTTAWADTSIDFTADLGAQSPGGKWIFVTNNTGQKNDPGFAVTVHRAQAFKMAASANIAASGEDTTVQLTAPATKTTADFDAGRIQDDENPADGVDVTPDDYTELEWCILGKDDSREVQYDLRITRNGIVLATYTVVPKLTISVAAAQVPHRFDYQPYLAQ